MKKLFSTVIVASAVITAFCRLPEGWGDRVLPLDGVPLDEIGMETGAVAFEGISGYGRDVDATLEYDRAGRLTRDPSRGITQVTYNRHGLPEWTYFDDGHATLDTYDGLGRHMATKRYTMETQGVDGRAGGFLTRDPVVLKPVNPGLLKTAANVREIPDTLSIAVLAKLGGAHYYITDHQGNNVAVADSTGRVEQRTDYYPYGTQWANSATHPFLYSGKEWLSAHGLNEYDFDARRYAPLIPRFTTLDPLCEKRPWESPYLYCGANPVNAIDPTGLEWLDMYGNEVEDLDKVVCFIFYSEEFEEQAMVQYKEAVEKYGKDAVALSVTKSEDTFVEDWENMSGDDIRDIMIMTHGKNQSIKFDDGKQLTSTGNSETNISGNEAKNVQDLPTPKGNLSKEHCICIPVIQQTRIRNLMEKVFIIRGRSKAPKCP